MQEEIGLAEMRVFIEMIDALGVERGRAALHAVHDIALGQQEFGEIGAVLSGDAEDECDLVRHESFRPRLFLNVQSREAIDRPLQREILDNARPRARLACGKIGRSRPRATTPAPAHPDRGPARSRRCRRRSDAHRRHRLRPARGPNSCPRPECWKSPPRRPNSIPRYRHSDRAAPRRSASPSATTLSGRSSVSVPAPTRRPRIAGSIRSWPSERWRGPSSGRGARHEWQRSHPPADRIRWRKADRVAGSG